MKARLWVVTVVFLALWPAFRPAVAWAQDPCADMAHHVPSPYLQQALQTGQFTAWKYGSSLILAFRVAACGGRWMFAAFRAGSFTTNFFPARGYQYILEQVRAARAGPVARSMVRLATAALGLGYAMETAMIVLVLPNSRALCDQIPALGAGLGICQTQS